jgi:cyclase
MNKSALACALAGFGSFALVAVTAHGQAQTDYSKVEIKTTKLTANFYTLEGSGGTIGVLAGPDGIFMVDGEFAPLTDKIMAAIRKISPGPVRFMVNTHVHGDHTGGNENFAKQGVTIFARPELRDRLAHPAPGANGAPGTPAPAAALPVVTYDAPIAFHMDGEEIDAIPVPRAHTDGDTMVHFVNADVIMTGDFYRSIQYPNIDRANGGSLKGMLAGLSEVVALAGPKTKIVPGHGTVVDRNAVAAHRDMILVLRDRVAEQIKQGKTQEQVVAAKLTSDYDSKVPEVGTTADRFIGQLYAELKASQ